jgi:hypothetical protein
MVGSPRSRPLGVDFGPWGSGGSSDPIQQSFLYSRPKVSRGVLHGMSRVGALGYLGYEGTALRTFSSGGDRARITQLCFRTLFKFVLVPPSSGGSGGGSGLSLS